jgi:hypothetical protein
MIKPRRPDARQFRKENMMTTAPTWKPITEGQFWRVAEWTRPECYTEGLGFLGGDPWTSDDGTGEQTYTAVIELDGKYYEAREPMTATEFCQLTPANVIEQISAPLKTEERANA